MNAPDIKKNSIKNNDIKNNSATINGTTNEIVVGIGSNQKPEKNIIAALDALENQYGTLKCSPVYKSTANTDKTADSHRIYYNLVVSFNCTEGLTTCKENLRKIEDAQGRKRNHSDVSCDLDLLLYGDMCATVENIQIPHHDIMQCAYVLRPLADLLPEKEHPQLKKTYQQLWLSFEGKTALEPVEFKWRDKLLSIQPPCLSL